MSDLRVTDVHAALRHFADIGHNVLTDDPHNLLFDNKKYGMVVGHNLSIHTYKGGNKHHLLASLVQQKESHIVSDITSMKIKSSKGWTGKGVMSVMPLAPHNGSYTYNQPHEMYLAYGVEHHGQPKKGMYAGHHGVHLNEGAKFDRTNELSEMWVPHASTHEALKAHHDLQPKLSPEELRVFDHPLALERLISNRHGIGQSVPTNTIYKGLVHISDADHVEDTKKAHYVYNPQTEEMHRYE